MGGLWPPAELTCMASGQLALKGASRSALLGLTLGPEHVVQKTWCGVDAFWDVRFLDLPPHARLVPGYWLT